MRMITLSSRLVLLTTSLCLDEKNLKRHPTFTLRDLLLGERVAYWGDGMVRIVGCKDGLIEETIITTENGTPFITKSVSYCRRDYWLGLYGFGLLTDVVARA